MKVFHWFIIGKLYQSTEQIPGLLKKTNDSKSNWKPLVIIIPLRLGLNDVNAEYVDQLKVENYIEKMNN